MKQRPDLTISIVSADNLPILLPCLESVFENQGKLDLEVFVVDNASVDDLTPALSSRFPAVQLIRNEHTLGFSSNNNQVLTRGIGRYLMLLNDDTVVLPGALQRLIEFADACPSAGVVGASLLNPDFSYQQAYCRFPHPLTEAFVSAAYVSSIASRRQDFSRPFEVDIVSGACFVVRREVVESVGMLDTAFDPIYSEEFDWCYRIKRSGWKVYLVTDAKVIHYGSQTMNRIKLKKLELLHGKKAYYFRKHHGIAAHWIYKVSSLAVNAGSYATLSVLSLLSPKRFSERKLEKWHLARKALTY